MQLQKINPVIRDGLYSAHERNPTTSSSGMAAFAVWMIVGSLLKERSLIVDPKVLIMNAEGSGNAGLFTGGSSHKSRPLGTRRCSVAACGSAALPASRSQPFAQSRGRLCSCLPTPGDLGSTARLGREDKIRIDGLGLN